VAASCFGALNATTFTTSRLIYVAGREHLLPAMFGELHPKRLTPVKALVLQGVLTSIMVILGDFSGLVMFYGIVGWSWYFVRPSLRHTLTCIEITVLGVVVLRVREPKLERYEIINTGINIKTLQSVYYDTHNILLRGIILIIKRHLLCATASPFRWFIYFRRNTLILLLHYWMATFPRSKYIPKCKISKLTNRLRWNKAS